jgi:hypothetical protein
MKATSTLLLLFLHTFAMANIDSVSTDSVKKPKEKAAHWRLTTRLHSKGMFFYSGRMISNNPVTDFNFIYDRKNWGLQVFKAVDLVDHTTDINFTLAVLYKNFKVGNRITITPNAGFVLDQKKSVADHGSDAVVIINTAFKLNRNFTFDNSAIFGSLLFTHEYNWTNRFRLLFSEKHIDATAFVWNNNQAFDHTGYFSTGLNVSYSRIKLSDHASLSTGITGLMMLESNDHEMFPKKNGILFTLALQLNN